MFSANANRILLALLLGITAAGANVVGGSLIARAKSLRRYLKYFIALGAGFMLATAVLEMIPESLKLQGENGSIFFHRTNSVFIFVLAGYFVVHFFEHTVAPHFHFGEETHTEEMSHAHASYAALAGPGDPHFFRRRGDCVRPSRFYLARSGNFSGDISAQVTGRIYRGVADAGERAEQARGVFVVGNIGWRNAAGDGADVRAEVMWSLKRCRFRPVLRCMWRLRI